MPLHDYQSAALDKARALIRNHAARRILFVGPTGCGKTEVYLSLAEHAAARGNRVGIFAHRDELIRQPAARLQARSVPFGIVQAGRPENPTAPIQLLSVQTVAVRGEAPDLDVLIFDEAHRSVAATYKRIQEAYPKAYCFGFTATPQRGDGSALDDAYDHLVVMATVRELQARGFLVPATHIGPLDGKKRSTTEGMCEDPVVMYNRLCSRFNRRLPALFFGENVAHAYALEAALKASGSRAACVEGETRDRDKIIAAYLAGELDTLTNCDIFTEGTDLPRTEVVAVGCRVGVWCRWIQIGGRGLRTAPGKKQAWILDPWGNTYEHGLLDDAPGFSLVGTAVRAGAPPSDIRTCKACGGAFRGSLRACPQCGAAVPPPPPPKIAKSALPVGEIKAVKVATHEEKWAEFQRLIRIALLNGHKPASAGFAFERQFGSWPPYKQATWDRVAREQREKICAENPAYK